MGDDRRGVEMKEGEWRKIYSSVKIIKKKRKHCPLNKIFR